MFSKNSTSGNILGNSMNIIIFLSAVFVAKYIGAQIGVTYNIFSDPFDFKLVLVDFTLYVSVYLAFNYLYGKVKAILKKLRQN